MLVLRNVEHLRVGALTVEAFFDARLVEVARGALRMVAGLVRLADGGDGAHLFQQVRHVEPSAHAYARNRAQHRDRRHDVIDLPERGIDRVYILPVGRVRIETFFELRRGRPTDQLVRQIDPRPLIQVELVHHLHDALDAHPQTEAIEIAVARLGDRGAQLRRAVVAHAARELVADLYAAAAHEVRVLNGD